MKFTHLILGAVMLLGGCAEPPRQSPLPTPESVGTPASQAQAVERTAEVRVLDDAADEVAAFEQVVARIYPQLPPTLQAEPVNALPRIVDESSGLAQRHGRLWTHNDSGHTAHLYELSADGARVLRRVHPLKSVNIDWEALAQDDTHLYIADCGNNLGDRDWMQIYAVPWGELDRARDQGVVAATQLDFRFRDAEPRARRHDHDNDCEALTVVGDELWLFTKNWRDQHTRLYVLDKHTRTQQVSARARFPVNGLITGADYDPVSQRLALVGYTVNRFSSRSFIWLIPVVSGVPDWHRASYHRLQPAGQWEAILWHQGDLLLTRERSILGQAQLARVRLPSQ